MSEPPTKRGRPAKQLRQPGPGRGQTIEKQAKEAITGALRGMFLYPN